MKGFLKEVESVVSFQNIFDDFGVETAEIVCDEIMYF